MGAAGLSDTLRSGVGRRILGLFLLAALLPVIFTAYLSYNEVHRGLEQQANQILKESAKSYGMEVLARLTRANDKARALSLVIRQPQQDLSAHRYLLEGFEAIWLQKGGLVSANIVGATNRPVPLEELNLDHLRSGESQLIWQSEHGRNTMIVVVPVAGGALDNYMFRLDPRRIWVPQRNLPFMTQFCMFTSQQSKIYCTFGLNVDAEIAATLGNASQQQRPTEYTVGNDTFFIASWQLFLPGLFATPPINIIAGQPRSYALRSSANFRSVFPPALALVIILVSLLSLHLIGKSLIPLNKLKLLAQQFAAGKLKSRIRLHTGDEFQALGETFNKMAGQLSIQFDTLKAMSEIDRLILEGAEFEEVGERVISSLINLLQCESAGVIARDRDSPRWAKMITCMDGKFHHERIALPQGAGHEWCLPRQVQLDAIDSVVAPYKKRFQAYYQKYVVIVPVILDDALKGVLLLGSVKPLKMQKASTQRSVDLAGRLAVALASAEREEALYHQAHFDGLTGLPNRQLLRDRLQQKIVEARRDQRAGALLFLDLDRFKEINDVYGHSAGDSVLVQAAERIVAEVRETDTVARIGGDEFVVVLPLVHDDLVVQAQASKLLERLSEPFLVKGEEYFLSASIGIAMFPDDGDSVETLLKNADAAMYRAKDAGRSRFEFCSEKLNAESRRKIELEQELRESLVNGALQVYYQPQFDLATGAICGAEALLRWPNSSKGSVSPAEFIPLAEDTGLITEIGRWVLKETCRNLRSILDKGLHPGAVSINVSGVQLRDTTLIEDVLSPLHEFDIHPGFIHLEITETAVAQNRDMAIQVLKTLRENGVKIAIDDFGTGYSSLSYLQQLPFDLIKIDKSFVDLIGSGDNSQNICVTIIKMAQEMGKTVIAEGVETEAQRDFLRENSCDVAQGYFYSKALPLPDFVEFIEKLDFHTQRRKVLELIQPG